VIGSEEEGEEEGEGRQLDLKHHDARGDSGGRTAVDSRNAAAVAYNIIIVIFNDGV
jgi:hypothetical protein